MVELDIHVVVDDDAVLVTPREVDRPCDCTAGEPPALGSCGGSSDALECSCDPAPASCLDRIAVEKDGEEIDAAALDNWYGYASLQIAERGVGNELVLEGCGGMAVIALDSDPWPAPTIEETSQVGGTLDVRWSTEPEATSVIASLSDGFVSTMCHDVDDGSEQFDLGYPGTYYVGVHALTSRVVDTGLGTATIWAGGHDQLQIEVVDYP